MRLWIDDGKRATLGECINLRHVLSVYGLKLPGVRAMGKGEIGALVYRMTGQSARDMARCPQKREAHHKSWRPKRRMR